MNRAGSSEGLFLAMCEYLKIFFVIFQVKAASDFGSIFSIFAHFLGTLWALVCEWKNLQTELMIVN